MGKAWQRDLFPFSCPLGTHRLPLLPPFILLSAFVLCPKGNPGSFAVRAGCGDEEASEETLDVLIFRSE